MILEPHDKVLVVHRRLFETDSPRFFVGEIEQFEQGLAKVKGHTWILDPLSGLVLEKEGVRTKLLPLLSGALIAYQLPYALNLSSVRFEASDDGRLWILGEPGFKLDMSETEYIRGKKRIA